MQTRDILERLIGFDTVSHKPNLALMEFVRELLAAAGVDAVLIPEAAIVQRGQGALVYVVSDNKVKEVRVSLGKRLEGKVEVKDGIAAGETVVTAGNARLSDGAEVEVVSAAAAAAKPE